MDTIVVRYCTYHENVHPDRRHESKVCKIKEVVTTQHYTNNNNQ